MIFKTATIAAIGLACLWGQSYAQDSQLPHLVGLQGAVLVDHGDGFVPVGPGAVFQGGDRVTTARGGIAKISYADGCSVSVDSKTMAVIDSASPCAGGPAPQALKTADDTTGNGYASSSSGAWPDSTGLVIGGLAAMGIGVAIGALAFPHHTDFVQVSVSP